MCNVCNAMREQEIETAGNSIRNATKEKTTFSDFRFSDLKPDANNKARKGHTGETEQMKKIIRKALYLKNSGTQTALDVR